MWASPRRLMRSRTTKIDKYRNVQIVPARKTFKQLSNMSGKLEIRWTPYPYRFLTWGSEICLYETEPITEEVVFNETTLKLNDTTSARLLSTTRNHHYVKSIDIYSKYNSEMMLAIGLTNGRVVLGAFGSGTMYDTNGLIGKELIAAPRHGRPCNAVSFNPIDHNLLAAGLDKYRSDNSVLLWDVSKFAGYNLDVLHTKLSAHELGQIVRPLYEFGTSEGTSSLAWSTSNSKLLACGMNLKNMKLYDIRGEPNKPVNVTTTKAVMGVCFDPSDDKRLASYIDNQVSVWDLRNFEKPIVVLPHNKPVLKVNWCPTKNNLLGVLQRDSSVLNIHNILPTTVGTDETEPAVLERTVKPGGLDYITSFDWHASDENRFISIDNTGTIADYTVFDRITLNWSPVSTMVWTYGRKSLNYINDGNLDDVCNKMKERTKKGYGLEKDLHKNGKLVDNEVLANVWNWLYVSGKLVEDGVIPNAMFKHPGVFSVLRFEATKSEVVQRSWSELGYPHCQGSAKYYKHEDRDKALSLCSWPTDKNLAKYLEHLEKENAYTRAAAIAVFNLEIFLAIDVLSRSPNNSEYGSSLNVVAMALAGFSDDKNSFWRQFCATSKGKLTDPYLKAMFAFLISDNSNYDQILNETGLTVDDRVAFACKFLPDNKLMDYLKKMFHKLLEEGNLDALLLTGNSSDGLVLLQKYLDATGDIQSTALIAVRGFRDDLMSQGVKDWIEHYRNLLDTWQLWYNRADFDIMLAQYRQSEKPPQQVYVSCNFCGKSISAYMHGLNRSRGAYTRVAGTSNKVKLTSCPNCRKPLPRCAICLMHMGTSIGEDDQGAKFEDWFTWCQTCRHGGHSGHMMEWFEVHQECPVTGCNCKCMALDFPTSCNPSM